MKKLKSILKDWILPPKITQKILDWRLSKERRFKKNWAYQPLDIGLPELPQFRFLQAKRYWFSLDKECRPAVKLVDNTEFRISMAQEPSSLLQLGLGIDADATHTDVKIFIDNKLMASIEQMLPGKWQDLRIALPEKNSSVEMRLEFCGPAQLILSHPVLIHEPLASVNQKPRNIICLVIDGITPENLVHEGPWRPRTITDFFKEGISCDHVYSQGDWTLPAFSSMLTSLYPSKHGVYNPDQYDSALPSSVKTLPEILNENHYRTFGYSGHIRFSPAYGHARGFERFIFRPLNADDTYTRVINESILHLEAHKRESNFLFLHLFDTHGPYHPTSYLNYAAQGPFRNNHAYFLGKKEGFHKYSQFLTDESIAKLYEVDLALNAFFSYAQKQEWFEDATFVLTADHGNSFNTDNKPLLMEERVSIPLLVKSPLLSQATEHALIEGSVDLMPSLLKIAGISIPENIDGAIWPFLGGKRREQAFSESLFKDSYQAVLRDEEFSYHYRYAFDSKTKQIDFNHQSPLVAFRRNQGRDVEKDVSSGIADQEKIFSRLKYYHASQQE